MIVNTRQRALGEQRFDGAAGQPRGVLRSAAPTEGAGHVHMRRGPASDLAHAIDHYWMVSWDLRGQKPLVAETLPHPNFHLVFEKDHSTVNGVFTGKFSRTLEGLGTAFGIKFQPGAFRPLLHASAASLSNCSVPAAGVFDQDEVAALESVLVSSADDDTKVEAAESFLRRHLPGADPAVAQTTQLIRLILTDPGIRTVEHLAARTNMNKRSLQRLFREYVGAPPKWVIRRYRLQELVEQLHNRRSLDYASLAQDLGFFDQAHLIRDFQSIVGRSPAQ